jgi:hypothetical protein
MRLNHKQKELIDKLYQDVKEKFPEIEFKDLSVSPDDPEHIWINIVASLDDKRDIELSEFASELEADIDSEFGYRISIMLENPNYVFA